ncbi:MAG: ParB/RepB/Spo0J family partition protein [Oscillospiraceae bacterium]|nr:ParB/RepB/Spo0J family partition protein [Oscillospiraceae bacterium]
MQKRRRIPAEGAGQVLLLPPELIRPNPGQPRRSFDRESLQELADSIQRHGLLQPIAVRRQGGGYELIAGERRLRAAKLAGLPEIPCLLLSADEAQSGLLALVENLQRKDLDCWEEAEGIARLMQRCGLSQEEAARRLGKSPSAVANKLRLLKHSPAVRAALREHGLSERHARALLKLPDDARRLAALEVIVRQDLTVAKTEAYVDSLLEPAAAPRRRTRKLLLKDVRLFLNSVDRHLETLKQAGIPAELRRQESEDAIVLTITLPKRQKGPENTCESASRVV